MQTRHVSTAPTVVGYQNKAVAKFSPIASTFTPVQGEEVWTYADYKVNCNETSLTAKNGWKANTDTLNTYKEDSGSFDKAYVYIPEVMAAQLAKALKRDDIVKGWYLKGDTTYVCQNDKQIDFGLGFIAKGSYADAAATFSGAVKSAPTVSDIAKFTVAGNVSAVDRWIGEIIVNCNETSLTAKNGWKANTDTLNTYKSDSGSFDKAYVYIPEVMAAQLAKALKRDDIVKGWYLKGDTTYVCQNEVRKFVAGEGFVAKGSYADATLTVKSALATDAE